MFNFNLAKNVKERMDMLESFIKFWMGDEWTDDFRVPEKKLEKFKMPYPLRRLYSFAGNLPPANPDIDYTDRAFSIQDHLCHWSDWEYAKNERFEFLSENQGNWECETLTEGEDPPVWCDESLDYDDDVFEENQGKVSDSLSKFLITYCLQELVFGAKFELSNPTLEHLFATQKHLFTNIWENGDYVYEKNDTNFYLFSDYILVSDLFGGIFAANSQEGINLIKQYQGEIIAVSIHIQSGWSINIGYNGSGEITFPGYSESSARFQASTFNFFEIRDLLLEINMEGKPKGRSDALFFQREGEPTTKGIIIPRKSEIDEIVKKSLENISEKDKDFDKYCQQYPIF